MENLMKYIQKYLLFIFILYGNIFAQGNLYINEFMTSNVLFMPDEYDEYDDWVEIYNNNSVPINIAGYYISDDPDDWTKFQIPNENSNITTIAANDYLILWADNQTDQGILHLNFNLSKSSGVIILTASDGMTIIDSVQYSGQISDVSYGRYPDASSNYMFFPDPTPEKMNLEGIIEFIYPPGMNNPSGFYSGSISLILQPQNAEDIVYYTLDASDPYTTGNIYTDPIPISQTTVVRAYAKRNPSGISSSIDNIFFINQNHSLPVLSTITDPKNFFDDSIGIYINYENEGRAWERKILLQYFINQEQMFAIPAGIRIQGNSSITMPKKSFRLFFREGFGDDRLDFALFDKNPVASYKNLVLRSGYDEDITTPHGTLIRDPLVTELWRRLGHLTSHSQFCVLYLNDEFWGIYDIRESINEYFIQDHLYYTDFDLIRQRWDDWEIKYGTGDQWEELIDFFYQNDLDTESKFDEAAAKIDIGNFTDLHMLMHFTQFRSWYYNSFAYRNAISGGKWQWTVWDMDRSLTELEWNGFDYYNDVRGVYWTNVFIKKLLQNESFQYYFINRFCDLSNTLFKPDDVIQILDSLALTIEDDISYEAVKWNSTVEKWQVNVDNLRNFIYDRTAIVKEQLLNYFNLTGFYQLDLTSSGGKGKIRINTIDINRFPWTGTYANAIPVEITAIPDDGYRFVGWSNGSSQTTIILSLEQDFQLSALFEPLKDNQLQVISPAIVKNNSALPLILRIFNQNGKINTLSDAELHVQSSEIGMDTTITVKKGVGTLVVPVQSASEEIIISISGEFIQSVQKRIEVRGDLPVLSYAGTLASGEVIWDSTAYRLITEDLTVTENTVLQVKAGTWIYLGEHVNIQVSGTFKVEGIESNPVVFISNNWEEPWGGIEFFHTTDSLRYCFFVNGGADPEKGWAHTNRQPILFAKEDSYLDLFNCFILNSFGKALGSINSKVNIQNCITAFVFHGGEFHYTVLKCKNSYYLNIPNDDHIYIQDEDNDAFHIDYLYSGSNEYSVIDNCFFITGKDDAVDHHLSRVIVSNCWIEDWIHEGVAASGGDTIKVFNTVVKNCEQGIEAGNGSPYVDVDHCVVIQNDAGLRFGDSYDNACTGHMEVTNTIIYNNNDNIWNFVNMLQGPYEGGIEIAYSMTNDPDYNNSPFCISGTPEFDDFYYLLPGSPGVGRGTNGSNMGRIDSMAVMYAPVIINEIMYRYSAGTDSLDWIELYNPQAISQDISGWVIKDDHNNHSYVIPLHTVIEPDFFYVFCENSRTFQERYTAVLNVTGDIPFGFGTDDQVRIFSPLDFIVDSVHYTAESPWPTGANGSGYSIELTNFVLDNTSAQNWIVSTVAGGTPGTTNSNLRSHIVPENTIPKAFVLKQNYPNPFNAYTTIVYSLPKNASVSLSVYNILGQKVVDLVNRKKQIADDYTVFFDAYKYASGIYFYKIDIRFQDGKRQIKTKKMLLIK
jgi:hypothetical protein